MTPGLEVLVHEGDGSDHDVAVIEVEHFAVHLHDGAVGEVVGCEAVTVIANLVSEAVDEMGFHVVEIHDLEVVSGPARAGTTLFRSSSSRTAVSKFLVCIAGVPESLRWRIPRRHLLPLHLLAG